MLLIQFNPLQCIPLDQAMCDAFNFYFNLQMTVVAGTIVVFMAIRLANRS